MAIELLAPHTLAHTYTHIELMSIWSGAHASPSLTECIDVDFTEDEVDMV